MALSRGVDPLLLEAISGTFHPVVFVEVDWPDGTVYAHSNTGNITWGGHTWVGVGTFGDISLPAEDSTLVSTEAVLSLRGQLVDLLNELDADISGKSSHIYFGATTTEGGNTLIGEPTTIFSGYVDGRDFSLESSETNYQHSLSVGLASGPSARAKASVNHSVEDSAINFTGDTLMRHTLYIDKNLRNPKVWPEP